MKLYNTLTRQKEEFVPITPGEVKMYSCGPTVYNYFHVGNARPFIIFDLLRRYFEYRGYKVEFVQNFTDIDDKVINKANEEGVDFNTIAERYIKEYFVDAQGLGVKKATVHPRATETMDAIIDVMRFWLDKGCDGFRVDMADSLVKHDDANKSGTVAVWQDILGDIHAEYPESAFVSEWGKAEQSIKAGFDMDFYLDWMGNGYNSLVRDYEAHLNAFASLPESLDDSTENNSFFKADSKGTCDHFIDEYMGRYEQIKDKGAIALITGNHDTTRISYGLSEDELKLAYAFFLTMPGNPFIYYGDEIAMKFRSMASKEGGFTRTGSRTPMQWTSGDNMGFSSAPADKLYLPVDPAENAANVEASEADQNSLLNTVKALTSLRRSQADLLDKSNLEIISRKPLVYKRGNLLLAVNPKNTDTQSRKLAELTGDAKVIYSIAINGTQPGIADGVITLPAQSFVVISC